jgi:hypothetical protein
MSTHLRPRRRLLRSLVLLAAASTLATACASTTAADRGAMASPPPEGLRPAKAPDPPVATDAPPSPPPLIPLFVRGRATPLDLHHVTQDNGTDRYQLHQDGTGLIVDAPTTNRSTPDGSATRAVIWPPESDATVDATTCATWARSSPWGQEGLALRVRRDGDRFRAIVIAKNTMFGASWRFNVYSWDSGRDPYFQTHGSVDLTSVFVDDGEVRDLPWRVCARTEGDQVRIKGWAVSDAQPGWSSEEHTGTVTLPGWLTYPGKAGWYAAHIDPGDLIALADLRAYARTSER